MSEDRQGDRGKPGCRGDRGHRGKAGFVGVTGMFGSNGPTGPCCTGPTGPKGPPAPGVGAGTVIFYSATVETAVSDLNGVAANVGFAAFTATIPTIAFPPGSPVDRLAFVAPRAGTLRNFYVNYPVAFLFPGESLRAEIYVNNIPSGIFVVFANGGGAPLVVPPAPAFAMSSAVTKVVIAGDRIALRITAPVGPGVTGWRINAGLEFTN